MATDTSQESYALDQGWKPIAWTRDYDRFRATIMISQDGSCMWRIFPFEQSKTHRALGKAETIQGQSGTLAEANDAITRIAAANPRLYSGPPTIIR